MQTLVQALFTNLLDAILNQAARADNRYVPAAFYGAWFHSPLSHNDYMHLTQSDIVERTLATLHQPRVRVKQEPVDSKVGILESLNQQHDTRKRIRVMELDEIVKQAQPSNTTIDTVRQRGTQTDTMAVTTVAYDGRSHIGVDSLSTVYAGEQQVAIETLKDSMERRFIENQSGVIGKMAQTLLVLALEPADLSIDFVLHQCFDTNFVACNLVETLREQARGTDRATPLIVVDDDDDDGAGGGEQLREFRRQVKKMTVNLYPRFPELAIDCTETNSHELLRALFSLWVCCQALFTGYRLLPQSEQAHSLQPQYRDLLEAALGDRSELLYAAIVSNIEGIGAPRWLSFRELFCAALMRAHLHVSSLHRLKPDSERLRRAKRALLATERRVRQYVHSSLRRSTINVHEAGSNSKHTEFLFSGF